MAITPDDYVEVLVPKQHLTRVYGFIASLDTVSETAASPTEVKTAQEAKEWTPELIKTQFTDSPDSIKAFQKYLAARPGTWSSTSEIAAALNAAKGSKSIAGALGAYGRRTSNRYGMTGWPFEYKWNHVEGQQYYSMTPEVAEIIDAL